MPQTITKMDMVFAKCSKFDRGFVFFTLEKNMNTTSKTGGGAVSCNTPAFNALLQARRNASIQCAQEALEVEEEDAGDTPMQKKRKIKSSHEALVNPVISIKFPAVLMQSQVDQVKCTKKSSPKKEDQVLMQSQVDQVKCTKKSSPKKKTRSSGASGASPKKSPQRRLRRARHLAESPAAEGAAEVEDTLVDTPAEVEMAETLEYVSTFPEYNDAPAEPEEKEWYEQPDEIYDDTAGPGEYPEGMPVDQWVESLAKQEVDEVEEVEEEEADPGDGALPGDGGAPGGDGGGHGDGGGDPGGGGGHGDGGGDDGRDGGDGGGHGDVGADGDGARFAGAPWRSKHKGGTKGKKGGKGKGGWKGRGRGGRGGRGNYRKQGNTGKGGWWHQDEDWQDHGGRGASSCAYLIVGSSSKGNGKGNGVAPKPWWAYGKRSQKAGAPNAAAGEVCDQYGGRYVEGGYMLNGVLFPYGQGRQRPRKRGSGQGPEMLRAEDMRDLAAATRTAIERQGQGT
eukprot:s6305_g1.t1